MRASVNALVVAGLGLAATPAAAVLLSATSATTDMGSGFGTSLTNSINGLGLATLSLTATHAGTAPNNSWVSLTPATTGQVTFNLGGSHLIQGFSFWNQNAGGPGPMGNTGINGVTVLGSTNGVLFTAIAGAPTSFAQQITSVNVAPQVANFAPVQVSFIRFQITSNWGDVQTGFGEVQFNEVPAPGSVMALAFGWAALARRRR